MMKQLEKDLKAVAKDFKKLTKKTEKMITRLKELEKAQAAKKAKPKAVRKSVARKSVARKTATKKTATKKAATKKTATKKTATKKTVAKKPTKTPARDTILAIVKRSKEGLDMATLISKTGLKYNNIRTILYRLRKLGKIKSERKGLYVKA
jgi:predicted Rossmann fold nucleotide-binding protein DprA/Smf involved in DNA uptake